MAECIKELFLEVLRCGRRYSFFTPIPILRVKLNLYFVCVCLSTFMAISIRSLLAVDKGLGFIATVAANFLIGCIFTFSLTLNSRERYEVILTIQLISLSLMKNIEQLRFVAKYIQSRNAILEPFY